MNETITKLAAFGGRIGKQEAIAAKYISAQLGALGLDFVCQEFQSSTPKYNTATLIVDGETIDCLPCGLKSGEITNNYNLISSLTSSQNFIDTPNINFNPKSDAICLCNFYFAPALAISRRDVEKVMRAKIIKGTLKVSQETYTAQNILVGNTKNPRAIVFAHYDAYFSGATDNASGVAVVLELVKTNPKLIKDCLFVFCGNEELSFDYPVYWGRCFREFKRKNESVLESAQSIYVVDSVGDGPPLLESEPGIVKLAFPIGDEPEILAKSGIVTGDFDKLMAVYHSADDKADRLDDTLLQQTVDFLSEKITR